MSRPGGRLKPRKFEDATQQRLVLQRLAASALYAFNLVLGQIDRPGHLFGPSLP